MSVFAVLHKKPSHTHGVSNSLQREPPGEQGTVVRANATKHPVRVPDPRSCTFPGDFGADCCRVVFEAALEKAPKTGRFPFRGGWKVHICPHFWIEPSATKKSADLTDCAEQSFVCGISRQSDGHFFEQKAFPSTGMVRPEYFASKSSQRWLTTSRHDLSRQSAICAVRRAGGPPHKGERFADAEPVPGPRQLRCRGPVRDPSTSVAMLPSLRMTQARSPWDWYLVLNTRYLWLVY